MKPRKSKLAHPTTAWAPVWSDGIIALGGASTMKWKVQDYVKRCIPDIQKKLRVARVEVREPPRTKGK